MSGGGGSASTIRAWWRRTVRGRPCARTDQPDVMTHARAVAGRVFALVLLAGPGAVAASPPREGAMSGRTTATTAADALRQDILATYDRLHPRGAITGSALGTSIDATVDAHLPRGMALVDAEHLLRASGFEIAPASPETTTVYASSDTILPDKAVGVRNEVVVILTPRAAGKVAEIGAVDARIVVTTF